MTHEELLVKIDSVTGVEYNAETNTILYGNQEKLMAFRTNQALRAVVELHKPDGNFCSECSHDFDYLSNYPCQTIQVIEKALF